MQRKAEDESPAENPYDNFSLEALGVHQFFGEVDEDKARAACEFVLKSNLVSKNLSTLTMVFNTVGGECGEGFAVIDVMETSRMPVATVAIGNIMSMGVLLLSAGHPGLRAITKNTEVMAHQFAGYFHGKQHELLATQASYKMLEDKFFKHFLRHSKMTEKQIRDVLFAPSDRYLTPAECLKYGLVDRVVDYATFGPQTKPIRQSAKARRSAAK
jgi:ATP-dependent Clp protease protease subunit